ncbi:MAG: GNAT family N-acetyltransferase [Methylovirgula sp.]
MRASLKVEVLDTEGAAAHVAAWQRLADHCLEPNIFLAPGFALAAARHLAGRDAPQFLFVWADDDSAERSLVGVCPLAPASGFNAFLPRRLWINEQAPLGTPLLDPDRADEALVAILNHCHAHMPHAGGLMFPMLPQDGPVAQLLRARAAAEGRALRIFDPHERAALAGGTPPHAYLERTLSGHRRRNLKRSRKLLEAQGALSVQITHGKQDLPAATQAFLKLESQGWKGRRGTAFLQSRGRADFAREALGALAAENRYFIVSLVFDGRPIAMALMLKSGARAFWWKTAYDEAFAAFSPGVLLALDVTSTLLADKGVTLTDSCACADHPMIDRIWAERIAIGDLFIAYDGAQGQSFAAMARRESAYRNLRGNLKAAVSRARQFKETLSLKLKNLRTR